MYKYISDGKSTYRDNLLKIPNNQIIPNTPNIFKNIFREFKYENGFDNEISFEDSFLELLKSEKRNDTNKRPRAFFIECGYVYESC